MSERPDNRPAAQPKRDNWYLRGKAREKQTGVFLEVFFAILAAALVIGLAIYVLRFNGNAG